MRATFLQLLPILVFACIPLRQVFSQELIAPPEKYSVLHFRIGTNSFREQGFNVNLFNRKIPELTTGFGYRSKNDSDIPYLIDECFSLYPLGRLINLKAKGPFFTIGYEMKNKIRRRKIVNPAFQIQIRRLKANNLRLGNHECDELETTTTESFNAKAIDVNLRGILDIGSNESGADFYLGIGICRRFLKKEIYKVNNLEVNKLERPEGAPIMSIFFGLRLSFMDTLVPNSSVPNMVSPN